jgi:phosphotriesterase-related protein
MFQEEGVDLSRVIIGHSGDSTDLEYLEKLIANGSYIGMDRFGMDNRGSFEDRVATVAEMCARGHANRMVLSHDAFAAMFGPEQWLGVNQHASPNWNWMHLIKDVLPALLDRGVTEEQIEQMFSHNPRDIFGVQGGY